MADNGLEFTEERREARRQATIQEENKRKRMDSQAPMACVFRNNNLRKAVDFLKTIKNKDPQCKQEMLYAIDRFEKSALSYALEKDPRFLALLIKHIPIDYSRSLTGKDEYFTPLNKAASVGNTNILRYLFEKENVSLKPFDKQGYSAFVYAVASKNEEAITLIRNQIELTAFLSMGDSGTSFIKKMHEVAGIPYQVHNKQKNGLQKFFSKIASFFQSDLEIAESKASQLLHSYTPVLVNIEELPNQDPFISKLPGDLTSLIGQFEGCLTSVLDQQEISSALLQSPAALNISNKRIPVSNNGQDNAIAIPNSSSGFSVSSASRL